MAVIAVIIINRRGGHVLCKRVDVDTEFPALSGKSVLDQSGVALAWARLSKEFKDKFDPKKHYIKIREIQPHELEGTTND